MSLYIENIYFLKLLVLLLTVFIVLMLLLLLVSLERQIHREKIQRKLFCLLFHSRGGYTCYTCGSWACWGQEPETSSGNIITPLWRKTLRTKIDNRTSSNPRFSGIYNPWAFQIPMLCFSGERERERRERGKEKRKEKLELRQNDEQAPYDYHIFLPSKGITDSFTWSGYDFLFLEQMSISTMQKCERLKVDSRKCVEKCQACAWQVGLPSNGYCPGPCEKSFAWLCIVALLWSWNLQDAIWTDKSRDA